MPQRSLILIIQSGSLLDFLKVICYCVKVDYTFRIGPSLFGQIKFHASFNSDFFSYKQFYKLCIQASVTVCKIMKQALSVTGMCCQIFLGPIIMQFPFVQTATSNLFLLNELNYRINFNSTFP